MQETSSGALAQHASLPLSQTTLGDRGADLAAMSVLCDPRAQGGLDRIGPQSRELCGSAPLSLLRGASFQPGLWMEKTGPRPEKQRKGKEVGLDAADCWFPLKPTAHGSGGNTHS